MLPSNQPGRPPRRIPYASRVTARRRIEGLRDMTDYVISAIVFVAIVVTLVFLWKREH
jgi:hypothetical protein